MMHLTHWIERTVVWFAAVSSSVVFVHLLMNTDASNIADIAGSMGLKAAVGFVALIAIIASWGLFEDTMLLTRLSQELNQCMINDRSRCFVFDEDQHVSIKYSHYSYHVEVMCWSSLLRTIYDVKEYSVDIYQEAECDILASLDDDGSTIAQLEKTNVKQSSINYKQKMKLLIKALDDHSYTRYRPTP